MILYTILGGHQLYIRKNNAQNEFKSNVFQLIVSEKKNFDFQKIELLFQQVNSLSFEHNKEYKIEFEGEIFEFIARDYPESLN